MSERTLAFCRKIIPVSGNRGPFLWVLFFLIFFLNGFFFFFCLMGGIKKIILLLKLSCSVNKITQGFNLVNNLTSTLLASFLIGTVSDPMQLLYSVKEFNTQS